MLCLVVLCVLLVLISLCYIVFPGLLFPFHRFVFRLFHFQSRLYCCQSDHFNYFDRFDIDSGISDSRLVVWYIYI